MTNKRIVHLKRNDQWVEVAFSQLCDGDVFRLYEDRNSDQTVGNTAWRASGDLYMIDGVLGIMCDPCDELGKLTHQCKFIETINNANLDRDDVQSQSGNSNDSV